MAFTEKFLGQGVASIAGIDIYTVPASSKGIVRDIFITNVTANNETINIYFVPNGSSAAAANAVFYTLTIPAYDVTHFSMWQVLDTPGDSIHALSSIDGAINIRVSGAEI